VLPTIASTSVAQAGSGTAITFCPGANKLRTSAFISRRTLPRCLNSSSISLTPSFSFIMGLVGNVTVTVRWVHCAVPLLVKPAQTNITPLAIQKRGSRWSATLWCMNSPAATSVRPDPVSAVDQAPAIVAGTALPAYASVVDCRSICCPRALAVRVWIRSRSTSASLPRTAIISRPVLVEVSAQGSAGDRNWALASTMCLTGRRDRVVPSRSTIPEAGRLH